MERELGEIEIIDELEVELTNQTPQKGEICGPVRLQIEGFRPIYTEVLWYNL